MKLKLLFIMILVALASSLQAATSCIVSGDPEAVATEGAVVAVSGSSSVNAGTPSVWTPDAPALEARIFTRAFSNTYSYDFRPGGMILILR
jgi:hypothetical protein